MMDWSYLRGYYLESQILDPSLGYLRCPACGFVTKNREMGDPGRPCPECHKTGEPRFHWPVLEAYTLFSMIRGMMKRAEEQSDSEMERATSELGKICGTSVRTETVERLLEQLHDMSWDEAETDGKLVELINQHLNVPPESFYDAFYVLFEPNIVTHEHKIVVILTMTLTEVLLDDFLANVLVANGVKLSVGRKCVRACENFRAKSALFKEIVEEAIKTAIKEAVNSESFLSDYKCVRNRRNVFIHGNPSAISRDEARLAFSVAVESFGVFANLFNKYCRLQRNSASDVHHNT